MKSLKQFINEKYEDFGPSDNTGKYHITGSRGTVPMCLWDAFGTRTISKSEEKELKQKLVDSINSCEFEEEQLEHMLNSITNDSCYSSKQWIAQKNSDITITLSRKDKYGNLLQISVSKRN